MSESQELGEFADLCVKNSICIIKELMSHYNLNQKDLANILGINQSMVSKNLNENKGFSLADLCKIARYFDLPLDYLVGRKPKKMSETRLRLLNNIRELLSFLIIKRDSRGMPLKREESNLWRFIGDIAYDELARYFGIEEDNMFMFLLNGEFQCDLTIEQIDRIAEFFDVSVDYLLGKKIKHYSPLEKGMIMQNLISSFEAESFPVYMNKTYYVNGIAYSCPVAYPAIYFPESGEYFPYFNNKIAGNDHVNEFIKKCISLKQDYTLNQNGYNPYGVNFNNESVYNDLSALYFNELKAKVVNQQIIHQGCLAKIFQMKQQLENHNAGISIVDDSETS